ncbi:DUF305 domain-containing protein [Streptomyces sp. ME01-24h]|nr:DUF305 domain-containing protein [Streptomyces sp. ME19-03-3]MDX3355233.1 DUF305 domain-containing protein [Streptomyces sp. ME01-24h]
MRAPRGAGRPLLALAGAMVLVVLAALAFTLLTARPSSGDTPDTDSPDAGFARDMAIHHQQAVEMSLIVRDRTDDEDVRRLAYDVINTQANQRGMLLGWLDVWGVPKSSSQSPMAWMGHETAYPAHDGSLMPGMATNAELRRLGAAHGKTAAVLYLQLLTAHHKGGVEMAAAAADLARTDQVRRLAAGMVQGQEAEIRLMADMLAARGASPVP